MTTARRVVAAVALSTLWAYALVVRPRMLRWGASDEEVRGTLPGADPPCRAAGAARPWPITIDAPPSRVWPWLVQMGCDRAGWYSPGTASTMGGTPSAQRIRPEWHDAGRWVIASPRSPSGRAWFGVAALEPERFLGLRASLDLCMGRSSSITAGPRPRGYIDALWGFQLKGVARGAHAPRHRQLLVGSTAAGSSCLRISFFWEPAHWVMQTRQLANLKRRAERQSLETALEAVEGPRATRGRPA